MHSEHCPEGVTRLYWRKLIVSPCSQVVFSDDSDVEDPTAAAQGPENKGLAARKESGPASHKTTQASAYGRKASRPKALVADAEGAQARSSDNCPQSSKAKPRRTRAGNRKAAGQEEKKGAAQRGPCGRGQGQEEEGELLRTIKEQEVMEEGFEISFEVLRGSDEEEPASGRPGFLAYPETGGGSQQGGLDY